MRRLLKYLVVLRRLYNMKYNLLATIYVQQEIEAESEDAAKEIFRKGLGLFATNPYIIESVEEVPIEEIKEELPEITEPT